MDSEMFAMKVGEISFPVLVVCFTAVYFIQVSLLQKDFIRVDLLVLLSRLPNIFVVETPSN